MRWLDVVRGRHGRAPPALFVSELSAVQRLLLFVVALLPAAAMTVGIVDPDVVPVEDLLGRTMLYGAAVAPDRGGRPGRAGRCSPAARRRRSTSGRSCWSSSCSRRSALRTAAAPAVAPGAAGDARPPVRPLRRDRGARVDPGDHRRHGRSSSPRSVARSPMPSGSATSVSRSTAGGRRAPGRVVRRPVPTETRTLPITYRAVPIGRLVLPARGMRSRLSGRDEQLLGDLVRQAATAARANLMADELQRGRERMVLAREEERRRIRRDLHDGLGPALVGDRVPPRVRAPAGGLATPTRPSGTCCRRPATTRRRSSPTSGAWSTTCVRLLSTTEVSSVRWLSSGSVSRSRRRSTPKPWARALPGRSRGGGLPDRGRGDHQRGSPRGRDHLHRAARSPTAPTCWSRSPTTGVASHPTVRRASGCCRCASGPRSSAAAAR